MAARRLVVIVPGIRDRPETWSSLLGRLRSDPDFQDTTWQCVPHGGRWYWFGDVPSLARRIAAVVNKIWVSSGGYDEVVLVGHSIGGVIVRQAFLLAKGLDRAHEKYAWADKVTRLVLFAGMNRGFDLRDKKGLYGFALRRVDFLRRFVPGIRHLLVSEAVKGSDFITNLRIVWIREFPRLAPQPVVVQLLGTRDWLVTEEDSADIEFVDTGYFVRIPDARHSDLHRLDTTEDPDGRYALIKDAFLHDPSNSSLENRNPARDGKNDVVMIVHGIRDNNYDWVDDMKARIEKRAPSVHCETPSYGRLSALGFAIPWSRRKYLSWFQDTYTELLARNPGARFSFLGHSNGTYLFAESVRALPGMRFDGRVILAASVLPREFDWPRFVPTAPTRPGQIRECYSLRANRDFPVGGLCSILHALGMRDVGPGGFSGFHNIAGLPFVEVFWFEGGHGAMFTDAGRDLLTELAVGGTPGQYECTTKAIGRSWEALPARAPWAAGLGAAALLAGVAWLVTGGWLSLQALGASVASLAFLAVVVGDNY